MMRVFNTPHVRLGKVDIQSGEGAEFATVTARESQCPAADRICVFHGAPEACAHIADKMGRRGRATAVSSDENGTACIPRGGHPLDRAGDARRID